MQDVIRGKVWTLGDNIDTDGIISGKYLTVLDPAELRKHVFEIALPGFAEAAQKGDIVVAGRNFACGSSREAAPQALRAVGVGAVLADSFARIFYRNCINLGVPAIEVDGVRRVFENGDPARIEMSAGRIVNERTQAEIRFPPIPPHLLELLEVGGLVEKVRLELLQSRGAAPA